MVEKYIKSNRCMLPWTSIETRPGGTYRPCCIYRSDIKDTAGVPYNTKDHTISEVMSSKQMKELRDEFRRNKRPSGCSSCWKEEDAGKISKRQHMWYKAYVLGKYHVDKDKVEARFVDLKLGNICNLKCRICSPHSSSQWTNDMMRLDPDRKEHWKKFNKEGSWPREPNRFYEDLEKHIDSIRFLEITGGEPLLIKEQFSILRKCVEAGVANKIDVHYNTNGTQFPEEAIREIWPHFKRVEIAFSIDDVGERFEYQRHPAKWQSVNENITRFKASNMSNMSMQICSTINVFNILHLEELADQVKEWNPDFWHINILHQPEEFDVQQLPKQLKKFIASSFSAHEQYSREIKSAIDYMMREPAEKISNWHEKLKIKIKKIDSLREENFGEVFPFLNKKLKIYD